MDEARGSTNHLSMVDASFRLRTAEEGELWRSNHRPRHEATEARVISQLMTVGEIDTLLHAAGPPYPPREHRMLRGTNTGPAAVYDVSEAAGHCKLYLHRGGHFSSEWPALSEKLTNAMKTQPGFRRDATDGGPFADTFPALSIRCVELHTYTEGGHLLGNGHRDRGSALTLSVLLTNQCDGGTFVTWKETFEGGETCNASSREPVYHSALAPGDAILFHSEKTHNVTEVTAGVRHSLVIELWAKEENRFDRMR